MYFDIEIQDAPICHRGACHDHKDCEQCNMHYEVVCDLFRKHCLQYNHSSHFEVAQVFRISNSDVKKSFKKKQAEMKLRDTILHIYGGGFHQANGRYFRDPQRTEIFQKKVQERRVENGSVIKEYIAVHLDDGKRGDKYRWVIKAYQTEVNVLGHVKVVNAKTLYAALSTDDKVPPKRNWRGHNGVTGAMPVVSVCQRNVVVSSKGDLESATRNYFREYFFRNSFDGRRISNFEIVDHISNTMTGKPADKSSLKEKKVGWRDLMKALKVDIQQNETPLKNFMQKQSDAAEIRWAWHGTTSDAVKSIASKNFDSAFSKRQVHGRGHYFSPDPNLALGYAQKTFGQDGKPYKCLLLCQVLLGHTTASRTVHGNSNTHQDFCYVVPDTRQIWPVYVVVVEV